jgi:hypothetical protein
MNAAGGGMIAEGIAPGPGSVILGNVNYIPPGLEPYFKRSFSYNILFNPINAAATAVGSVQINNDSYFVITEATADIWDAATGNTTNTSPDVAPMTVIINDSSSGQNMMDQATPIGALFGTGKQPMVWLYRSNLLNPGGQMSVTLANRMGTNERVQLTFTGFKVYPQPDQLTNIDPRFQLSQ